MEVERGPKATIFCMGFHVNLEMLVGRSCKLSTPLRAWKQRLLMV